MNGIAIAGLQPGGGRLPDYLTTEEVAEVLGYHVKSIHRIIKGGRLRADKKSGIWLIPREALEEYQKVTEGKSKHDPTRGK